VKRVLTGCRGCPAAGVVWLRHTTVQGRAQSPRLGLLLVKNTISTGEPINK
jgi:hypothetical protein